MVGLKITILRYISDDPQPGVVECQLEDAHGRLWRIVDKTAVVSAEYLDVHSTYPQQGIITAEVVGQRLDSAGRKLIRVDTGRGGIESVEGVTQFEVLPNSLAQ